MSKPNPFGGIHATAQREILDLAAHYRLHDEMDPRIWKKLDMVLRARDLAEAHVLAKKATESAFLHCLSAWSKKKADGPPNQRNLEKQAQKAESLAEMLDKKGDSDAAEKQRRRAEELRQQAENPPDLGG